MSKAPGRNFCTSCKKQDHGNACQKGKCSCMCRFMSDEEIKNKLRGYNGLDSEYAYSEESNRQFETLMNSWKKNK